MHEREEKKQKNCVFNRNKSVKRKEEKEKARMRKRIHTVFKMKVISYLTRQRPVRTDVQGYCMHRHTHTHTYSTALNRTRSISSFFSLFTYSFIDSILRKEREREEERLRHTYSLSALCAVDYICVFLRKKRKKREE